MKNAIILCSGGLDSVVAAHYVKKKGYDNIKILFFDYGQKCLDAEKKASKKCAKDLGADFEEIELEWLGKISDSLINKKGKIKKMSRKDLKNTRQESEKFYVPFRNGVFLSYAVAFAESLKIKEKKVYNIFVGFKCEGREAYPDTTRGFVSVFNDVMLVGKIKGKIIAPLIKLDKDEIVKLGKKLGVDLKNSFSCYVSNKHCGSCLGCKLRQEAFYWANVKDDSEYVTKPYTSLYHTKL